MAAKLKAKYFIDFMYNGVERTVYFDKLPADKYKGRTGIYYVTRLTDQGTALLPIMNLKTLSPVKAKSK
jgi:hypothetical protein